MRKRIDIKAIVMMLVLMGISSCSDDSSDRPGDWQLLEMVPYTNNYQELEDGTRAEGDPYPAPFGTIDGYVPYADLIPQADAAYSTIHVFLTQGTVVNTEGDFAYHDDTKKWTSSVWMEEAGTTYHVYGYMSPKAVNEAILVPNGNSFENKAILYLNGLNGITPVDVCVVTGVKGLTKANYATDISESGIEVGKFAYTRHEKLSEVGVADENKGNYIYLLLDHLYTCLNLNFQVSAQYSKLRKIKLRKVELGVEACEAYNVKVTINGSQLDVNYTATGTSSTRTAVVFDRTRMSEGLEIPTTTPLNVPGYFSPKVGNSFVITTTYDVFDKKDNLIRANQTAVNHLTPANLGITGSERQHERGRVHPLSLIIEPTYLYQLSDADLDNPTIRVGS